MSHTHWPWFAEWLKTVPVDKRSTVLADFKQSYAEMCALGWPLEEAAHAAALAAHLPGGFHA